jgi:hypothetical protein
MSWHRFPHDTSRDSSLARKRVHYAVVLGAGGGGVDRGGEGGSDVVHGGAIIYIYIIGPFTSSYSLCLVFLGGFATGVWRPPWENSWCQVLNCYLKGLG